MRAIQLQLPNPKHTEIHRIFVKANPEEAWLAARHFDGASIPWVRLLFDMRAVPDMLAGNERKEKDRHVGIDQITQNNDSGFILLHETPGKAVVVGAVGQFWHLSIPFKKIKPEEFNDFNEEGWGKVAWAISVEPYRDGSTISFELRTTATESKSWEKLNTYYHIIGLFSNLIRSSVMAHFEAALGKLKRDYDDTPLAGDDIMPQAQYRITHFIDIEAPASVVWNYLMQLGCDRAGWYIIDALDNGGRRSTNHIVPGWEYRYVGDKVAATPEMDGFFDVLEIIHEKSFVLGGESVRLNEPFKSTWAFVLEPIGDDAVTLITRARMQSAPKWKEWLLGSLLLPPVHALMEKVQLYQIKKYAEQDAHKR